MPHKHFDQLKTKKLPDSEVEITGEITLSFLVECRAEALKELNNRSTVAGFRPGKIPEDMLVKKVGELGVLEESAEIALGREYPNIIRELKISAVGRPTVSITKLAKDIPLEFKLVVAVEPEFKLPDYKKIARTIPHPDPSPTLGEGVDTSSPPLNVRGGTGGVIDEKQKQKHRITIIDALIKATEIVVPKVLIESELLKMMGQFKDDVSRSGLKWEDYLKNIKKTEENIREEWKENAVKRAKAELIVSKIAVEEKIEPTEAELEHETTHLLEHYKEADPTSIRLYVFKQLQNQKVFEFLESLR